ncbi:MAG: tail fiber domain-containing protein, partial [Porticoccaceae bacterium]
ANDWFRVNGADGIYWQSYAGGWQMTDSSWMRVYNNKGIYTSGEIQGGTINTPSDINLKKDIVKIDDALDKLHQLNGYNFTFKATDKKSSGVIAQEVQKVMPQLVHEGADEGTLTVEYGNMVGLLIEAIKEQQTQIDDLKAEIQSMKS